MQCRPRQCDWSVSQPPSLGPTAESLSTPPDKATHTLWRWPGRRNEIPHHLSDTGTHLTLSQPHILTCTHIPSRPHTTITPTHHLTPTYHHIITAPCMHRKHTINHHITTITLSQWQFTLLYHTTTYCHIITPTLTSHNPHHIYHNHTLSTVTATTVTLSQSHHHTNTNHTLSTSQLYHHNHTITITHLHNHTPSQPNNSLPDALPGATKASETPEGRGKAAGGGRAEARRLGDLVCGILGLIKAKSVPHMRESAISSCVVNWQGTYSGYCQRQLLQLPRVCFQVVLSHSLLQSAYNWSTRLSWSATSRWDVNMFCMTCSNKGEMEDGLWWGD